MISRNQLLENYNSVRAFTEKLCEPLQIEDYVVQSMQDVSPTRWHLAHTSWFFEAFILSQIYPDYKSINDMYAYLFNSYYVQKGDRFSRPHRGLLTRPTVMEVFQYRRYVDLQMIKFLESADEKLLSEWVVVLNIGLNHEQQHQELMMTDLKHVFSQNPLHPVYKEFVQEINSEVPALNWHEVKGGVVQIGFEGNGFFYDNEKPQHNVFINNFEIASRLVTNREYIQFIEDDGYARAEFWLSDGFAKMEQENWSAPLYWEKIDGKWWNFSLQGFREVDLNEPVSHISFYEAEAYAHWAGARLATEFEWETASKGIPITGNFVEAEKFHPVSLRKDSNGINQLFGDVWEWTRSDYAPYPGYKVPPGAIGEYNGKFMSGQYVLRGGSCVTSATHIRNTYRNFFHPASRWQFSGIRLARDF